MMRVLSVDSVLWFILKTLCDILRSTVYSAVWFVSQVVECLQCAPAM